jgi:hypothetical protein
MHPASTSRPEGSMKLSNFDLFAQLMDEPRYRGNLVGDISAITQGNRMGVVATLLARCALLVMVLALVGCGSLLRNGVPTEMMSSATIPGMPDVRAPAGRASPVMERDMAKSFTQESASDFPAGADGVVLYPHHRRGIPA